ncbi:MAG: hypothetical protein R3332_03730 [Pseudohongiellaceae bacterium]|nr:hypothetical protein [Pseudohongiellaceae bacterium]
METKSKLWVGLGVVVAASTALYGCSSDSEMDAMDHSAMSAEEGGEGGEGASTAEATQSDTVYLGQLAFIRGHLNVGVNLYQEGYNEGAVTHMKHPGDEIYTNLLPAMEARDAVGFAEELEALANAIESGASKEQVEEVYQALLSSIGDAEAVVSDIEAKDLGLVIVDLVRIAAAEYDIAVADDGSLENEHEYQDSLGFVRIAKELLTKLSTMTDNAEAVASIEQQLDALLPIWPSIRAPEHLEAQPSQIYGAAGSIEFALNDL